MRAKKKQNNITGFCLFRNRGQAQTFKQLVKKYFVPKLVYQQDHSQVKCKQGNLNGIVSPISYGPSFLSEKPTPFINKRTQNNKFLVSKKINNHVCKQIQKQIFETNNESEVINGVMRRTQPAFAAKSVPIFRKFSRSTAKTTDEEVSHQIFKPYQKYYIN